MANLPKVTGTNPTVSATLVTNSGQQFIQVIVTDDMTGTAFFNGRRGPNVSSDPSLACREN
jgi:hypothetical protein